MGNIYKNQFLRAKDVIAMLGISKSTLYAKVNPNSPSYDPSFPCRYNLGPKTVVWSEDEIVAWIKAKSLDFDTLAKH